MLAACAVRAHPLLLLCPLCLPLRSLSALLPVNILCLVKDGQPQLGEPWSLLHVQGYLLQHSRQGSVA